MAEQECQDRDHYHAPGFALDVGNRIEGDLRGGGGVAAEFGDQRVRGFMAGGGKKEDDVGDEPVHQQLWRHVGHVFRSVAEEEGSE